MTYFAFHLVFLLPPIAVLAWWVWPRRAALPKRAAVSIPLLSLIALAYTTPWDNHLVASGVWSYGADRVAGVIWHVPVEEYLFFLIQPVLTGLWMYLGILRSGSPDGGAVELRRPGMARLAGALAWAAVALAGALALTTPKGTYMGLILAWAAPVLALLWAFAGAEIWRRRRLFLGSLAAPTVYLWIVDAIAIHRGIWHIAEATSTGLLVFGLPIEEAVFFLMTNLLVVQGLVALLYPPVGRGKAAR